MKIEANRNFYKIQRPFIEKNESLGKIFNKKRTTTSFINYETHSHKRLYLIYLLLNKKIVNCKSIILTTIRSWKHWQLRLI